MPLPTIVTKILGTRFTRELKHLRPLVEAIHRHEEELKGRPDEAIRAQTAAFRERITARVGELRSEVERLKQAKHDCADPDERDRLDRELLARENELARATAEALDELLPEAFATVREACRRLMGTTVMVTGHELTWDMVPYDVQLIGGIVLHQGKIAEMATGEGKTLVAMLPLYLNALPGLGAHLVTVNDYLARRDSQWMGHVFGWLGLTVGCIDDTEPGTAERRAAYLATSPTAPTTSSASTTCATTWSSRWRSASSGRTTTRSSTRWTPSSSTRRGRRSSSPGRSATRRTPSTPSTTRR